MSPVSLHLVSQLVDKSLVQVDHHSTLDLRFRMLETIREFGLERLEAASEEANARDLHANAYLSSSERAERFLRGPRQAVWFNRLDDDHPNLRAALVWFRERGQLASALRLAAALGRFWEARGHLTEGRAWFEDLLVEAGQGESSVPRVVLAKAESWVGTLTYWQGDFARSDTLHASAVRRFEEAGDEWGVAYSLLNQGQSATFQGDLDRAIDLISTSYRRFQAIGSQWGIAAACTGLVNPLIDAGDHERAAQQLAIGMPLVRSLDDPDLLAMTMINVGWLASSRGEEDLAERALVESLALFRQIGDRRTSPYTLNLLGLLAWRRGDRDRASAMLVEALTLSRDLGTQLAVVNGLEALRDLAVALAMFERAARILGAIASLRLAIGAPVPPVQQAGTDAAAAASRARLGDATFDALVSEGCAQTIQSTIDEGVAFARSLAQLGDPALPETPDELSFLTRREMEILHMLVEGHSNQAIASNLFISQKTVRNHVTRILAKLKVETRTAAATFALRRGLV